VTVPADPVLAHGNRLGGAKGPQPIPLQWGQDLVRGRDGVQGL
jgi:hypothetical protein